MNAQHRAMIQHMQAMGMQIPRGLMGGGRGGGDPGFHTQPHLRLLHELNLAEESQRKKCDSDVMGGKTVDLTTPEKTSAVKVRFNTESTNLVFAP